MTKRKPIDWESIEREYRTGQVSVREIARVHGISDNSIRKKATKEAWPRDVSNEVRKEVRAQLVRSEVRDPNMRTAIHEAAARGVEVIRQHRKTLSNGQALTNRLLDELDATTSHVGELAAMIEADVANDKDGKRKASMERAISLPARAQVMSNLANAAMRWVNLERQAFNLDESPSEAREVVSGRPMSEDEWSKAHTE